jgi:hypothetical protein
VPEFSDSETLNAIQDWLKYGMDTFNRIGGHRGYFSPGGFAFECLRAHFEALQRAPVPDVKSTDSARVKETETSSRRCCTTRVPDPETARSPC